MFVLEKVDCINCIIMAYEIFNTYSMKQPDLYYFETIKMTLQGQILYGGYRTTTKNYVVCRNTAQVVKLKVHVLQLLNA